MPNTTPESNNLQEIKRLISEGINHDERARSRVWILAKFDVQGKPQ